MTGNQSGFKSADDPPAPVHTGKAMRFALVWRHPGETAEVSETYEKETDDPERYSRELLDWFNSTLRAHEKPREFVRCVVEGEVPAAEHRWTKLTAMTQSGRYGSTYDRMQCSRCGITGKRYGIQPHVKIDSKFKLKTFQRCDTAIAAMRAAKQRETD